MKSKFLYTFALPAVGALLLSAAAIEACGSDDDFVSPPDGGAGSDAAGGNPGDDNGDDDSGTQGTDAGTGDGSTPVDAGIAPPPFEYHHQPFVYFQNWGGTNTTKNDAGVVTPNGKWVTNHNLQDEQDFFTAAANGTLPAVSFVKPLYDEHPNYTTETDSQNHTVELINAVYNGPSWPSTAIFITYDENGGHADHVAPPVVDSWGPGTRVPGILISPFAKGGVDSTTYDTTAVLALIENRWNLQPLQVRDSEQEDLSANAMNFGGSGSLQSSINHIVVIYLENHSFDSLFGSWTGAEGLQNGAGVKQVGPNGAVYSTLPQYGPYPPGVENLGDASVANGPFDFTTYFQEGAITNDLLHRFYQEQLQINGGKMDSYALWNNESAGQSMGYWPTASLPVPQWMMAHPAVVTLCDQFFHAGFGGSFLNHFWLIGARSPVYRDPQADAGLVATTNAQGLIDGVPDTTSVPPGAVLTSMTDGELTPPLPDFGQEGADCSYEPAKCVNFAVNTAYSVNEPHPSSFDGPMPKSPANQLVPVQTWTTIGDRLDEAGQTWVWYSGGWNAAVIAAGIPSVATSSGIGDAGPLGP